MLILNSMNSHFQFLSPNIKTFLVDIREKETALFNIKVLEF